jgi:tRNA (adenine37-N6)-methyltransferase
MPALLVSPIGYVRGGRADAVDDNWGAEQARIVLVDPFGPEALFGLSDFSHAEVIFQFNKVPDSKIETGARHPRGNTDWPLVGIFAQRGKNRPNRIGLCTCQVLGVEGRELLVQGLDAIDGTPVLDIKPVMREFLPRETTRQPDWASELMKDYW